MAKDTTTISDEYNMAVPQSLEQRDAELVFRERLVDILTAPANEDWEDILADYNLTLLNLLLADKKSEFRKKLAQALRDNKEKLTHQDFILTDKPARPTIGNWLRDFIAQHGAAKFDNVKLAQYLSEAKNVKLLDESEKQTLRRLLLLYRNVSFFPASMPNNSGDGWEIIPSSQEQAVKENIKKQSYKTITKPQKLPVSQAAESNPAAIKTPPPKIADPQVQELEKMAVQYPAGSLERKAIEEEMNKLKSL